MLIAAGTMLEGKYRVERLLGAGGMGSVWIAEHVTLHRAVAIKVLDSAAARRDPHAAQRFLREAQTAARLRSDHIVDVLDMGKFDDGTPFLVMELLEGDALSTRIRSAGRLSQGEAAQLVDQLLEGLGAAHAAGVVHRDIKPDNCFITQKNGRDHLKLLDFGISKVAATSPDAPEMRMTRTGVVMGTPYYMAPEQARGAKEIDHRCDLYAAGAILYECVTGRVPFEAESVNELLFKIVLEPLAPPGGLAPELDEAFEGVVMRAMAREAADRFQTAEEFRNALAPFVQRVSAGTVVMVSVPPGLLGRSQPVSGAALTAPVDSDPERMRPQPYTPPAGLTATGPQPEVPRNRGTARWTALGLSIAVVLGAVGWGLSRNSLRSAHLPAAEASPPTSGASTPTAPPPDPLGSAAPILDAASFAPKASASPSTLAAAAASGTAPERTIGPSGGKPSGKKPLPPLPSAAPTPALPGPTAPSPTATAVPTTTTTGKQGSPRPIDTTL